MFSKPYRCDTFHFDNPAYDEEIRHFTKEAPLSNELRGSKHFLYTGRVHTGLYSILKKNGCFHQYYLVEESIKHTTGYES